MKIEIVDNFLKSRDFKRISNLTIKKINKTNLKVYHNSVVGKKVINSECIKPDYLSKLNKNYHNKAIKILKKLCKEKVKLYDYSEFHIIVTGANRKFPIHDDTPNKLLSGVIYLKPNKNFGTNFFSTKSGKSKKTIPWKLNRAVFFSRKERETWHSYQGDGKSNRIVLVYNLMTKNIKEVYKVEKKNYFLGNLRYKINPYFYRFFNITI
jgi:hypothetical protein